MKHLYMSVRDGPRLRLVVDSLSRGADRSAGSRIAVSQAASAIPIRSVRERGAAIVGGEASSMLLSSAMRILPVRGQEAVTPLAAALWSGLMPTADTARVSYRPSIDASSAEIGAMIECDFGTTHQNARARSRHELSR